MRPCLEEGEVEGASLLLKEEEGVEVGVQKLLKVKAGYLQYWVRAAVIAVLVDLIVKTDNQFGWSL
jgi:hypothetical protein